MGCLGFFLFFWKHAFDQLQSKQKKKRHQNDANALLNKVNRSRGTFVGHWLDTTFL